MVSKGCGDGFGAFVARQAFEVWVDRVCVVRFLLLEGIEGLGDAAGSGIEDAGGVGYAVLADEFNEEWIPHGSVTFLEVLYRSVGYVFAAVEEDDVGEVSAGVVPRLEFGGGVLQETAVNDEEDATKSEVVLRGE